MARYMLVPGTGGCNFNDEAGTRAAFVRDIVAGNFMGWTESLVQELSCQHAEPLASPWAPLRTSLKSATAALSPREVLVATAYEPVAADYAHFAYDWRLDIRYNAGLLLDQLRQGTDWRLLSHSQGGLVVIAASLLCADGAEWSQLVSKVCFVGVPFLGTAKAMAIVIHGDNFGGTNSEFFRRAARTWPAIIQSFPQYACVANESMRRSTSASLWPGEQADFYALLARAKSYFQWVNYQPFRNMDLASIMIVLGKSPAKNTPYYVSLAPTGPKVSAEKVVGDSLVPYHETVRFLVHRGARRRIVDVDGPHQPDHSAMLQDVRVYDMCNQFLRS